MSTRPDPHAERGDHLSRWLAVLGACGVVLALLVSGCTGGAGEPSEARAPDRSSAGDMPPYVVEPAVELRAVTATSPTPSTAPPQEARAVEPRAGAPTRLLVPELGIDAPVVGISAPGGVLVPPGDPQVLGWWRDGAVAGAAHGGALITGHTVHSGGGAFDHLETLEPGDRVVVRTAKGRIRYGVTAVTIYRKASLAQDAARVFRQSGPGRLVLITCEDWNGSGYDSNAVVFAEPV